MKLGPIQQRGLWGKRRTGRLGCKEQRDKSCPQGLSVVCVGGAHRNSREGFTEEATAELGFEGWAETFPVHEAVGRKVLLLEDPRGHRLVAKKGHRIQGTASDFVGLDPGEPVGDGNPNPGEVKQRYVMVRALDSKSWGGRTGSCSGPNE